MSEVWSSSDAEDSLSDAIDRLESPIASHRKLEIYQIPEDQCKWLYRQLARSGEVVPAVLAEAVACERDAYTHKPSHTRRQSNVVQQDDLDLDLQLALQSDIHSDEEEAALRNSSDRDNSISLDSDEQDLANHKVSSFGCSSMQDALEIFMGQSKGKSDSLYFILVKMAMAQSQLKSLQPFDIPSRSKLTASIKQSPAWKEAYSESEIAEPGA